MTRPAAIPAGSTSPRPVDWNYEIPTSLSEVTKVLQRRIDVHRAWADYLEANPDAPEAKASIAAGIGSAGNHRLYIRQYHAAIEMIAAAALPSWVAEFLDRRTEVEHVLRAPMNVRKRNARGLGKPHPEPAPLTVEAMWDLANELSVPAECGSAVDSGEG